MMFRRFPPEGFTAGRAPRYLASLCLSLLLLTAAPVLAQHEGVRIGKPFTGQRDAELNLHGGLTYRGPGAAGGLRLAFPIVDNGFVSAIDNAIYLTVGFDLIFERCVGGCGDYAEDYGAAMAVPFTGRWQFNFTPKWSAYAEVGPTLYIHTKWFGRGRFPGFLGIPTGWIASGLGGKWHFSPRASLTLGLVFPYTHVGIDILL
ncbi:MAG: hypothetical protein OEZ06_19135 [Myxococcales bacterium]|nr:hypothetical protein [Myxococcales bacterium]